MILRMEIREPYFHLYKQLAILSQIPTASYNPFYSNYGCHSTVHVELSNGDEDIEDEAIQKFLIEFNHIERKQREICCGLYKRRPSFMMQNIEMWSLNVIWCCY